MVKKGIKIIAIALLVFVFIFLAEQVVFAENTTVENALKVDLKQNTYSDVTLFGVASRILGFLQWTSIVIGIVVITFIGIKYITGSIEEKAEYKKEMFPLVIGIFVTMSAFTIGKLIFEVFTGDVGLFNTVEGNLNKANYSDNAGAISIVGRLLGGLQWVAIIGGIIVITILGIKYMLGSLQDKVAYKKSMVPLVVGIGITMTAVTTANLLYNTFDKNVVYEWKECYICKKQILKGEEAYKQNTMYFCKDHNYKKCAYSGCENKVYPGYTVTGYYYHKNLVCPKHYHGPKTVECYICGGKKTSYKYRVYDATYGDFHFECRECKMKTINEYLKCNNEDHDGVIYYNKTIDEGCPECYKKNVNTIIDEIYRGYSSTGGN